MTEETSAPPLTATQWLICVMAAIGFLFDIYEILVMPLILREMIPSLVKGATFGTPEYTMWSNLLLFLPLVLGGLFGLVGGYLTDLWGRRQVLVWSILLYAVSAAASGFATTAPMLLVFRCLTLIGVCVEFVAAVAWLAEIFPNPKQRETVLGATQAFSSFGGLLSAQAFHLIGDYAKDLPAIHGGHEAWRYTLISGVVPALPLILIRPFMPESPIWQEKKAAGTLNRPSFAALFSPDLRRTTIVTTLLFACAYGAAFGAIQMLPQIVPGVPQVVARRTADSEIAKLSDAEKKAAAGANAAINRKATSTVQTWQEVGGLLGRIALALLIVRIASRRTVLRIFQIPGLLVIPWVFWTPATTDLNLLQWGAAFAGFCTVAQFSFWGNYLPQAYPTHLRGTGGIFAANVGGRILGTAMFPVTMYLSGAMSGAPATKIAHAAAIVVAFVFAAGLILSFFLPEPRTEIRE